MRKKCLTLLCGVFLVMAALTAGSAAVRAAAEETLPEVLPFSEAYSDMQGKNGWYYLYGNLETGVFPMRYLTEDRNGNPANFWKGPGWNMNMTADSMSSWDGADAVRMWQAGGDGRVSLSGYGAGTNPGDFDGYEVRIVRRPAAKADASGDTTLFAAGVSGSGAHTVTYPQGFTPTESTRVDFADVASLQDIAIERGDKLYFVLSTNAVSGDFFGDNYQFAVTTSFVKSGEGSAEGIALGFEVPSVDRLTVDREGGFQLFEASLATRQGGNGMYYAYTDYRGNPEGVKRLMQFDAAAAGPGLAGVWRTEWGIVDGQEDYVNVYAQRDVLDVGAISPSLGIQHETSIEWRAPAKGRIYVAGRYRDSSERYDLTGSEKFDGTALTVYRNREELAYYDGGNYRQDALDFSSQARLQGISVSVGDTISFTVDGKEHPFFETAVLCPIVYFVYEDEGESFSSVQGENGWYYAFGNAQGDYYRMSYEERDNRYTGFEPDNTVTAKTMTPGRNSQAIRFFAAENSGTLEISAIFSKASAGGDGVRAEIRKLGASPVFEKTMQAGDTQTYRYSGTVEVAKNDIIAVAVDCGGRHDNAFDTVNAQVSIAYALSGEDADGSFELGDKPFTASITLAPVVSDHMVLQRGREAAVFGGASKDGVTVTVQFNGQTAQAVTRDGRWVARLAAMEANATGGELTVFADTGELYVVKDVVVGEVWLAGGQSNMEFTVGELAERASDYAGFDNYGKIRIVDQPNRQADAPQAGSEPVHWVQPGSVTEAYGYSAFAVGFALTLQKGLGVPVGILSASVSGSAIEEWLDADGVAAVGSNAESMGKQPSKLYNGMIAPLLPYSVAGLLWYQGEANAAWPSQYARQFERLVADYRGDFDSPDMAVVVAQLPKYEDGSWPEFRKMQWELMSKIPNCYTVCGIDLGEVKNIHPKDKKEFSARAGETALSCVYGLEGYRGLSPHPTGAAYENGKLTVSFGEGVTLTKKDPEAEISGVEAAGRDGVYREVTAKISGGKLIVDADFAATRVRYAYLAAPIVNLFAENGLPVAPFVLDVAEEDPEPGQNARYAVSVAIAGSGSVTPDGGEYEAGSSVILTIAPANGWKLGRVLVNGEETTVSGDTLTLTVDRGLTVSVTFTKNAAPAAGCACGTISGGGSAGLLLTVLTAALAVCAVRGLSRRRAN